MGKEISDEKLEELLHEGIQRIYGIDAAEADPRAVPIPIELRDRVLAKAAQVSGMLAAAEARADVEIVGWEPAPGTDAEHYYMTGEELKDLIAS